MPLNPQLLNMYFSHFNMKILQLEKYYFLFNVLLTTKITLWHMIFPPKMGLGPLPPKLEKTLISYEANLEVAVHRWALDCHSQNSEIKYIKNKST